MKLKFSFHPEARKELRTALDFYREAASPAIAREFLTIFDSSIERLRKHPASAPLYYKEVRRKVLRKFLFSIMYYVKDTRLRVLAVAHQSRKPYYWLGRK